MRKDVLINKADIIVNRKFLVSEDFENKVSSTTDRSISAGFKMNYSEELFLGVAKFEYEVNY